MGVGKSHPRESRFDESTYLKLMQKLRACGKQYRPPDLTTNFLPSNLRVIWDRGRPARNERAARKWIEGKGCAPTARCGRDARGPRQSLARLITRLQSILQDLVGSEIL